MDIKKIVGKNLKQARLDKGITQKEAGALLNILQQAYARFESGTHELDYYKILFYCKAFEITPNELFNFDETQFDKKETTINNSFNGNSGNINFKA